MAKAERDLNTIPRFARAQDLLKKKLGEREWSNIRVGMRIAEITGGNPNMYQFWRSGRHVPDAVVYSIICKIFDDALEEAGVDYRVGGRSYWIDATTGRASSNFSKMETAA